MDRQTHRQKCEDRAIILFTEFAFRMVEVYLLLQLGVNKVPSPRSKHCKCWYRHIFSDHPGENIFSDHFGGNIFCDHSGEHIFGDHPGENIFCDHSGETIAGDWPAKIRNTDDNGDNMGSGVECL